MEKRKYIQLGFEDLSSEENDQLIALLSGIGYSGFEEIDRSLNAFVEELEFNKDELDRVMNLLKVEYSKTIIEEENWNAQWESSFEPIMVMDASGNSPWVAVRAGFHSPVETVKHEIIITPKMSFGTGHHATTYMMIQQMKEIDFGGKAVVDYGTGTAVLAILAEKLGAVEVDGIDYDQWSIDNAAENIAINKCSNINLQKSTTVTNLSAYDIILANINLNVILENLSALKKSAKPGALLLLSGFHKNDESKMQGALEKHGILVNSTIQNKEWICMSCFLN